MNIKGTTASPHHRQIETYYILHIIDYTLKIDGCELEIKIQQTRIKIKFDEF